VKVAPTLVVALGCASFAQAQSIVRVSVSSSGGQADGDSFGARISADGRFVAFHSRAHDLVNPLVAPDGIYVRDLETGVTELVSASSDGAAATGGVDGPSISANGRFVTFATAASNLVLNDTNTITDVFVHDRQTRVTTRVSVDSNGNEAMPPGGSASAVISASGRVIAFVSSTSNLVPRDVNNLADVFAHDLVSGRTVAVSVSSEGVPADRECYSPSVSGDGRYVAFVSSATNLVPHDPVPGPDTFIHDLVSGETTILSADATGQPTARGIPTFAAGGRFVALLSDQVYRLDRQTNLATIVSIDAAGRPGNDQFTAADISSDGRFVTFQTRSSNLVPGDTQTCTDDFDVYNCDDIFVHDVVSRETSRVSMAFDGSQPDLYAARPAISADGRFVAFDSDALNLVPGDTGHFDVFVRDLLPCAAGDVNVGAGATTDVLFVNGEARVARLPRAASAEIRLDAAPAGPANGRYVLWIWSGPPTNQVTLGANGASVGCTVNPTPLTPMRRPQPMWCMHGVRIPHAICGAAIDRSPAPAALPWTRPSPRLTTGLVLTLQAVVEDASRTSHPAASVTNAVLLVVP
jgi:Tol biopolymer transport system component